MTPRSQSIKFALTANWGRDCLVKRGTCILPSYVLIGVNLTSLHHHMCIMGASFWGFPKWKNNLPDLVHPAKLKAWNVSWPQGCKALWVTYTCNLLSLKYLINLEATLPICLFCQFVLTVKEVVFKGLEWQLRNPSWRIGRAWKLCIWTV